LSFRLFLAFSSTTRVGMETSNVIVGTASTGLKLRINFGNKRKEPTPESNNNGVDDEDYSENDSVSSIWNF
jgi:hypothetical protein